MQFIKSTFLLLLLVAVSSPCIAQPTSIFIEGLGSAGLVSVNAEFSVAGPLQVRAGLGYLPEIPETLNATFNAPVMGVWTVGQDHQAEFGAGPVFRLYKAAPADGGPFAATFFGVAVGYRYESPGGLLFRLTFTPTWGHAEGNPDSAGWVAWAGISVGHSF